MGKKKEKKVQESYIKSTGECRDRIQSLNNGGKSNSWGMGNMERKELGQGEKKAA